MCTLSIYLFLTILNLSRWFFRCFFYGTKVLKSIVFPKHNWFLLPHHLSKYQFSKYLCFCQWIIWQYALSPIKKTELSSNVKICWKKVSIVHMWKKINNRCWIFSSQTKFGWISRHFHNGKTICDIIISSSLLKFMIYGAINFNEAV